MTAPDTTEAVREAADEAGKALLPYFMIADRIIEADRKALAEQGYVIVSRHAVDRQLAVFEQVAIDEEFPPSGPTFTAIAALKNLIGTDE